MGNTFQAVSTICIPVEDIPVEGITVEAVLYQVVSPVADYPPWQDVP